MRFSVLFTLLILALVALQWTDAGLLRRLRRLRRIGPPRGPRPGRPNARSARFFRLGRRWPHFLAPPRGFTEGRGHLRRTRPGPTEHQQQQHREEQRFHRPGPHHHPRLPLMMAHSEPMLMSESSQLSSWRPLDFGNPIDRDPTFDYAPPSLERVKFADGERKRLVHPSPKKPMRPDKEHKRGKPRPTPNSMFGRPRRPSIWKLLATKQRRRPYPKRRPGPFLRFPENHEVEEEEEQEEGQKLEAEVIPQLPNIVYFNPADVLQSAAAAASGHRPQIRLPAPPTSNRPGPLVILPPSMKPGLITTVPLYSHEHQSTSQFTPVTRPTTPLPPAPIPKRPDDILYRPQVFMNPTRQPASPASPPPSGALPPAKSTPVTLLSATRNSVLKPVEPTPSLSAEVALPPVKIERVVQPKPLNSFTILSSVNSVFGAINQDESELLDGAGTSKMKEKASAKFPDVYITTTKPPAISTESDEESTTISFSTSVSHSTSVRVRGTTEMSTSTSTSTESSKSSSTHAAPTTTTAKTTTTTTTAATTKRPLPYNKLPEMPTYKKRQPIYPKRFNPVKSSSTVSSHRVEPAGSSKKPQDSNGSGEAIVVMSRSKVKNYKPQFLANYTQLLTFDKVAETEDSSASGSSSNSNSNNSDSSVTSVTAAPSLTNGVSTGTPASAATRTSTSSSPTSAESTSSKSPMQDFDPMQLLHSWFQNT